jgi:hypothetical protein
VTKAKKALPSFIPPLNLIKMKKIIIANLIIFSCALIPLSVFAQDESEPSPSPDEVIKQKVEERIEKVVNTAEEETKQAFVGEIENIANSTLTLQTSSGQVKAKVADDATILNTDRDEINLENLEIGEKAIVMGYADDQGNLDARRVLVIKAFQIPQSEAIFGTVTDISSEEKILTVKTKDETIYTVEMDKEVEISQTVSGEKESASFSDIEENENLIIIGQTEENAKKIITAKLIHLLPSQTEAASSEKASPSPSPKTEEETSE